MKRLAITSGSALLAALLCLALSSSTANAAELFSPTKRSTTTMQTMKTPPGTSTESINCDKVLNALKGPSMTPRLTARTLHMSIDEVIKCQTNAAKKWGSGPIPDQAAHPVLGPGGNYADPGDYATKFKQRAW